MLKKILNKFLILHDVRGVIVILEDGGIVESIKSGMEYDDAFMAAVSTRKFSRFHGVYGIS